MARSPKEMLALVYMREALTVDVHSLDAHIHDGALFVDIDGTFLGRADIAGLTCCKHCSGALTRWPCGREPCECGSGMHDDCCCGTWQHGAIE